MFYPFYYLRNLRPKVTTIPNSGATLDGSGYLSLNPTLGPELAVNGGFDSDTVWTKGTGWTIAGGKGVATNASSNITQAILTANNTYRIIFEVSNYVSGNYRVNSGGTQGVLYTGNQTVQSDYFSPTTLAGVNGTSSFNGQIDNFTCKLITGLTDYKIRRSNPDSVKISLDTLKTNQAIRLVYYSTLDFDSSCIRVDILFSNTSNFLVFWRKFVNGTSTTLMSSTPVTFVDGAEMEVRRINATTFALYYNDVQLGTNQTITDSQIINNEYHGIRSFSQNWKIRYFKFNDVLHNLTV